MPELVIGGILLGPVLMGIIQVLKHYGLPERYAPFANLALSFLAGLLVLLVQMRPDILQPVTLALQIVILFLSTAGYYTTAKWAWEQMGK
jgi:hypothetical protein